MLIAEARHPHAQQPHRAGRRIAAQELDRHLPHPARVARGPLDRACPRHRREVVEAHLDRDRAPAALVALEAHAELGGHAFDRRLQLRAIRNIVVEGALARLGDRLAHRRDRALMEEVRTAVKRCAEVLAEAAAERLPRARRERSDRGQANRAQARCRLRADSGNQRGRRGGEPGTRLLAREDHESRRLLGVRGDLGDELVGADPDGARQLCALSDLRHQPAHRGVREGERREVEVGLVESHHLDALRRGANHPHELARTLAVGREVGLDEDRFRAEPTGARSGHRRADPVPACLVARRGDHRAWSRSGDHHRLAEQLRAPRALDRDVEGVDVEVGDQMRRRPALIRRCRVLLRLRVVIVARPHAGNLAPPPAPATPLPRQPFPLRK